MTALGGAVAAAAQAGQHTAAKDMVGTAMNSTPGFGFAAAQAPAPAPALMAAPAFPALPPPPPPPTAEDIDARLAKLDHIKGRLSDEEYERRRNAILDSI